MTLRLPEDSVDPQNVIENFVEENERNVKLFLVENFESGRSKEQGCKCLERMLCHIIQVIFRTKLVTLL